MATVHLPMCCSRAWPTNSAPPASAVLMTGMGDDGAEGMGAIKAVGGMTLAQSEESCVVNGMPRAAIDQGFAVRVVGLDVLANTLQAIAWQIAKRIRQRTARTVRPRSGKRAVLLGN